MSARVRIALAIGLTVLLLGGAAVYCVIAISGYQARQSGPATTRNSALATQVSDHRIVFVNTQPGDDYGHVASVSTARPSGTRTVSDVQCDRVYSTSGKTVCLRIDRGILTTFSANLLDAAGVTTTTWPLPGIPSRARLSADGSLVAFTSFVTGAAYATVGFSTATQISTTSGTDYGNLEAFALTIDGARVTAIDRNFWGVTFASDDNTFYATAATGGQTWLVRGDLAARTLTSVRETAECPSVSPDGTRIAYKKNISDSATAYWSIAVYNLATKTETLMPDTRTIDDQVEWLDDSTLLYSVPRESQPGDSDIWAIAADGRSASVQFIRHASSPSVVRE